MALSRAAREKIMSRSKHPYVVVGFTGRMGSGKSTCLSFFNELDPTSDFRIRTLNADKIGHSCYLPGEPTVEAVAQAFGREVVGQDGAVNRKVLGPIVFGDCVKLKKLNEIVWPAIAVKTESEIKRIVEEEKEGEGKFLDDGSVNPLFIIFEAAVLLEANWDSFVDLIWLTECDDEVATSRVAIRNGLTEAEVRMRMAHQLDKSQRDELLQASDVPFHSFNTNMEKDAVIRQLQEALLSLRNSFASVRQRRSIFSFLCQDRCSARAS